MAEFELDKLVHEWGALFNAATLVFSKDISKASKGGGDVSSSTAAALDGPKKGTAGIVASLSRMAKIPEVRGTDEKLHKARTDAIGKELKTLSVEAKKYVTVLDAVINGEVKVGQFKKAKVKDQLPESYRQLKLLKTGLLSIEARVANYHKGQSVAKESRKIDAKKEEDMKKARKAEDKAREAGNAAKASEAGDKAKAIQAEARLKKMLLEQATQYKAAMAKGALVIQKIKQSPDVATYNKEMNNGGRDIRQQILNIGNMKTNPGLKDLKEVKALPAPGTLAQRIEVYATDTGGRRRLADTATKADVAQALADFTALFKEIATTYAKLGAAK
jgi:hypothetical protein